MTKLSNEQLSAMYEQSDEEAEKRQQPEQLRLAGKATMLPHGGGHLAVPRIEYIETLERMIRQQQKMIEEQSARIRKLELQSGRATNIAERRLSAVESKIKDTNRQGW